MLYNALLYWDSIATVVPREYEQLLDERMVAVEDAGLYRPIHVDRELATEEGFAGMMWQDLAECLRSLPIEALLAQPHDTWPRPACCTRRNSRSTSSES
jgi:hypothetical protein